VIGFIGNNLNAPLPSQTSACGSCCESEIAAPVSQDIFSRIRRALRYTFWEMPKEIGLQLLIGAAVASVIVAFAPVRDFVRVQLDGFKGYLILIIIGLLDYVCSTGSVPVAHALVQSGVSAGKSMVYLLMGPITSYATLLVIRKEFGSKILMVYLLVISLCSVMAGVLFDVFRL